MAHFGGAAIAASSSSASVVLLLLVVVMASSSLVADGSDVAVMASSATMSMASGNTDDDDSRCSKSSRARVTACWMSAALRRVWPEGGHGEQPRGVDEVEARNVAAERKHGGVVRARGDVVAVERARRRPRVRLPDGARPACSAVRRSSTSMPRSSGSSASCSLATQTLHTHRPRAHLSRSPATARAGRRAERWQAAGGVEGQIGDKRTSSRPSTFVGVGEKWRSRAGEETRAEEQRIRW